MRRRRAPSLRGTALLATLAGLLLLSGCFEEPVRDELTIRFQPGNVDPHSLSEIGLLPCEIELVTRIEPDEGRGDNPNLQARVDERRRQILSGQDAWAARFTGLGAGSRHVGFDWEDGVLRQARRVARLDLAEHPDALHQFFADTAVAVDSSAEHGRVELSLTPLAAGRANRRQRQLYDRFVGPWTDSLATYFRATSALYTYLDRHPGRARVTLGALLGDALDGEDADAYKQRLRPPEKPLVEAVDAAMDKAAEVLVIDQNEAYSINEISRLLFDPFPAHIRVIPGGPVIEAEGFEPDGSGQGEGGGRSGDEAGVLEIRGFSLWEALESLQGRWLAPDPLLLYVRLRGGIRGEPTPELTLDQIAARDRFAATPSPSADEIRAAIEERLRPEPLYRVVWQTPWPATP